MNCGKSDRCKLFDGVTCEYGLQPRVNYLCFELKAGQRKWKKMTEELKPCPFCGGEVRARTGVGNIHFFECTYARCGAVISFRGTKRTSDGTYEAENPRENYNRRADNAKKV